MSINKRARSANLSLLATICALVLPTMLEQCMQTAVQYIDTAMVGALGTAATAAVGSTGTINWLVNSVVSALSIGFLAFIAKALGAREDDTARRAAGQAVLAVLVCGSLLTAVTLSCSRMIPVWMQVDQPIQPLAAAYFFILYLPMLPRTASIIFGTVLRAAGDSKTPMKIGVLVNLINVILNFLFIYETRTVLLFSLPITLPGLGMGVLGAAIASAIAFTVGGIFITVMLFRHPLISPRGQSIRPNMTILRPCLRVAVPNMLQRAGTSFGYVVSAGMINSLGEVATAAHTVANTVESAFYIPGYGMQTAAATLTGMAYGARDNDRMKRLARLLFPMELLLMLLSGLLLLLTARPLAGLFSTDAAVLSLSTTVLQMVALSEPFFGFSIVMEGMMQGVGKTRAPFLFNLIGMWGIRILGMYLCTQQLSQGLVAAWGCMILHNMFLFLLYFICLLLGSWNPLRPARKRKNHQKG